MKKIGLLLILLSIINCENKESKSQTKIEVLETTKTKTEETSEVIESTDIFEATKNGNFNDVQKFITDGVDVNYINIETENSDMMGTTPLMVASSEGHIEIVKLLIKHGADANLKSGVSDSSLSGESALQYALEGEHTEVAEYLETIK